MARRVSWQEQLRRTTAIECLEKGRYDQFPFEEVQAQVNTLLHPPPFNPFRRRNLEIPSEECDVVLIAELGHFKRETNAEEAALAACMHAFTDNGAYGLLIDLRKRSETQDEFFIDRVRAYLQCLLLACRVKPEIFQPDIPVAEKALPGVAKELFDVVKEGPPKKFPSILKIVKAIGQETCEAFLPMSLIRRILRKLEYRENLRIELEELKKERKWYTAHQLVGRLRRLGRLPLAAPLLSEFFPDIPLWASWFPNVERIKDWEGHLLKPYREQLAPVFDLEGPDTTGNQLQTLRQSSSGIFADAFSIPKQNDEDILDHLLDVLDSTMLNSVEAVEFFITVCVEPKTVTWEALERVEATLDLPSPAHIRKIHDYMLAVKRTNISELMDSKESSSVKHAKVSDLMRATTAALPVIQSTKRLQKTFGAAGDIMHQGVLALTAAQMQLYKQLRTARATEKHTKNVAALGRALHSAKWLHKHWQESYIEILKRIPNESTIATTFRIMRAAPPELHPSFRNALAIRVCGMDRRGTSEDGKDAVARILDVIEDPIWCKQLNNRGQTSLRNLLLRELVQGLDGKDATLCVKQSLEEHETVIEQLRDCLLAEESDMACVNLAAALGPRCISKGPRSKPPAECWRRLLMHMMRRRPPGLLERCDDLLSLKTWLDWVRHLNLLYGERHYDPEGGLGFTKEKFDTMTVLKVGLGRTTSTSTYSTGSTGVEPPRWR